MCCPKYIDLPELEPHFEFVWKSLCRLYDAASEGHNPLVNVWDKTEYAALVGPHTVALKHFEALNPLWVESGHQEYDGNDGFYRLLDSFIAGYEISINEDEDA
ncbi:hypothetical protein N431DRAFT_433032 [Stipitochalara longipes BDJ]|nr:hypothetical protein N431DRAFT_433032 [Stipitochalara longipes BDJ]